MKKLKVFSVKNMSALTREEIARIHGGDFYRSICAPGIDKKNFFVPVTGGIETGVCETYYVVYYPTPTTSVSYAYAKCKVEKK